MPEWPELERYRTNLSPLLCGYAIDQVEVRGDEAAVNDTPAGFRAALTGRVVLFVELRGKHLLLHLDDGRRLLIFLAVGGSIAIGDAGAAAARSAVVIRIAGGARLQLNVPRYGYVHLLPAKEASERLKAYGPDPFDSRLTAGLFHSRLARYRGRLDTAFTAQKVVSGIGKRYAGDIIRDAGLQPDTAAASLSRTQSAGLYEAMRRTLRSAVELSLQHE